MPRPGFIQPRQQQQILYQLPHLSSSAGNRRQFFAIGGVDAVGV